MMPKNPQEQASRTIRHNFYKTLRKMRNNIDSLKVSRRRLEHIINSLKQQGGGVIRQNRKQAGKIRDLEERVHALEIDRAIREKDGSQ